MLNSQKQSFQELLGGVVNVVNSEGNYVTVNSYGERII
jgi:hypothetical protein